MQTENYDFINVSTNSIFTFHRHTPVIQMAMMTSEKPMMTVKSPANSEIFDTPSCKTDATTMSELRCIAIFKQAKGMPELPLQYYCTVCTRVNDISHANIGISSVLLVPRVACWACPVVQHCFCTVIQ